VAQIIELRDSLGLDSATVAKLEPVRDSLAERNRRWATDARAAIQKLGNNPDQATVFAAIRPRLAERVAFLQQALRESEVILGAERWAKVPEDVRNPLRGSSAGRAAGRAAGAHRATDARRRPRRRRCPRRPRAEQRGERGRARRLLGAAGASLVAAALWTAPRWLVPRIAARSPRCLYAVPTDARVVALTSTTAPTRRTRRRSFACSTRTTPTRRSSSSRAASRGASHSSPTWSRAVTSSGTT
jgi:hypothetical protein